MPEVCVVEAQFAGGDHVGRVQGERALLLRDGFLRAPLDPKDAALLLVSSGPIGIEGERLRLQFVGPREIAFTVAGNVKHSPHPELGPQ